MAHGLQISSCSHSLVAAAWRAREHRAQQTTAGSWARGQQPLLISDVCPGRAWGNVHLFGKYFWSLLVPRLVFALCSDSEELSTTDGGWKGLGLQSQPRKKYRWETLSLHSLIPGPGPQSWLFRSPAQTWELTLSWDLHILDFVFDPGKCPSDLPFLDLLPLHSLGTRIPCDHIPYAPGSTLPWQSRVVQNLSPCAHVSNDTLAYLESSPDSTWLKSFWINVASTGLFWFWQGCLYPPYLKHPLFPGCMQSSLHRCTHRTRLCFSWKTT